MNVQDAKELTITEGQVRTIHDKDNKLIWGRLAYDTKYAGNTIQDGSPTPDAPVPIQTVTGTQTVTVCGKNWFNKKATPTFRYHGVCTEIDTGVRVTCNSSTSYSYALFVFDVSSYIGKTITLSANVSVSASNIPRIAIGICDASGENRTQKVQNTNTGQVSVSYTIASSDHYIFANFSSNAGGTAVTGDYADYKNAQLEIGPATAYEPYQSHDYTVDLGTTELCKIGTYQDYIYKSGDNWYVHKEIGKVILNGTESWEPLAQYSTFCTFPNPDAMILPSRQIGAISNNFSPEISTTTATQWGDYPNNCIALRARDDSSQIGIKTDVAINVDTFKTWLSTHNTTVYYVFATPTDTKITDNALIGQLEAIQEWTTRYGYQASVNGSLPIVITQTTITE